MDELLFIVNPIAGGGRAKSIKNIIEKNMMDYPGKFSIISTQKPEDAIQLVMKSKVNTLIAVGGDGTVTEVARAIIKRGYGTLGIIPGGTGNDLIKSLDIPKDPEAALRIIKEGSSIDIDVGIANGHEFLNIASVGLDAEVVYTAKKNRKYIKGRLSYILSIFITLIKFKKKNVRVELDGKCEKKGLVLFAIGNGKYYGGGVKMIPNAQLSDGFLYCCIAKDVSKFRVLTIMPEVFKGKHLRHKKYVENFKTKKVKIYSEEDIYMNLDGDLFFAGKEIEFSLSNKKLKVIVPSMS